MQLRLTDDIWMQVKDGYPPGKAMYDRHYSSRRYKDGRKPKLFCGPGEKMVLMTPEEDALFVWRKFRSMAVDQTGINCAVFRNESSTRASDMILAAEDWAAKRWPGERAYTYVNGGKIKSTNPGYCFIKAGWTKCGHSKGGLLILEKQLTKETDHDSDSV